MFYCCWLSGFHSFTLQYRKYSIVDGLFNQLYADVNVCILRLGHHLLCVAVIRLVYVIFRGGKFYDCNASWLSL